MCPDNQLPRCVTSARDDGDGDDGGDDAIERSSGRSSDRLRAARLASSIAMRATEKAHRGGGVENDEENDDGSFSFIDDGVGRATTARGGRGGGDEGTSPLRRRARARAAPSSAARVTRDGGRDGEGTAARRGARTAAKDARTWLAFGRGRIDGSGVRFSVLVVLFLSFVIVTEWARDREKDGMFSAFTPRYVRLRHLTPRGEDGVSADRFIAYGASGNASGDHIGTEFRTYMDHGIVRLEGEVCGSTSMMALTVFAVCASIGLNDILWTASAKRRRVSSTVLYITIVACYTHYLMVQGSDLLVKSVEGTYYSLLRYLEWMLTTPVLLILVFQLHALVVGTQNSKYRTDMYVTVVADEVMLVMGMLVNEMDGPARGVFFVVSMACFFYIIGKCVSLFQEMLMNDLTKGDRTRFIVLAIAKTVCWMSFPAVFVAKELGYIDTSAEHEWFLSCDVLTKAAYCLLLSAGNIRVLDVVRDEEVADIERLTKMQRDFFFNITHELRMPLNSVIGFNTLAVESGELTDVADGFIKNSLTSAEALLGLINQVLDYAKFNRKGAEVSGGHGLELSDDVFTIEELLDQTLSISQRQDYTGNVYIRVDPSLFRMTYTSDFFRLRQCLVNVVNNALKFSSNLDRPGNVIIDVHGQLTEDKAMLTFSIEDNGVGIPEERQNQVFIPFSQQSDYSALRVQGTGLGLTITKTIIELMGGSIDFTSKPDVGTMFNISLELNYKPSSKFRVAAADLTVLLGLELGLQMRTVRNVLACYRVNPERVIHVDVRRADRSRLEHLIDQSRRENAPVVLCIEEDQYFENREWLESTTPEPFVLILSKSSRMKDLPHSDRTRAVMKPVAISPFIDTLEYLSHEAKKSLGSASDITTNTGFIVDSSPTSSSLGRVQKKDPESELDISSMRVLLVEDNRLNQQVAIQSMKKCKVTVDVAENGLIATQKIEDTIRGDVEPYDVVFMDMMMPVMDGNEATRRIRAMEQDAPSDYKRAVIIALSANVGPEHTIAVMDAGCDGSLGKPFYPSTLRKLLHAVFLGEYDGFAGDEAAIRPGH